MLLEQLKIASPCPASWAEMVGTEQVRFCQGCRKNVYNLSAMTQDEAQSLVTRMEGNLCVRFYRRADGTLLTRDCSVGQRTARFRLAKKCSYAAAVLLTCGTSLLPGGANAHALRARLQPHAASKAVPQAMKSRQKPRVYVLGGAPPPLPAPQQAQTSHPVMGGITAGAAESMAAPIKPVHAKP